MKSSYKGFAIYLLVVILGVFSCNDAIVDSVINNPNGLQASLQKDTGKLITNAKEAGKVTLTGIVPKDKLNDSIIYVDDGTKALDCKTRVEVGWQISFFLPVPGKYLGVWTTNERVNDFNKIEELKDTWGFTYYFHANAWNTLKHQRAMDAGFGRDSIIIAMSNLNYSTKINDYKPAYAYYIDEPLTSDEYDYSVSDFINVRNKINQEDSDALFITGDTKPVICLDPYVSLTDIIMCTTYKYGYLINYPCTYAWWPVDYDQRPMWTSFKNRYGVKSKSNWIAAHADWGSFNQLIGRASNLGQNLVWYYQLEDDSDAYSNTRITTFCSSAWQYNYLRRFSQKITRFYKCIDADCATCESEEGIWVLYNTIYGEIREDLLP